MKKNKNIVSTLQVTVEGKTFEVIRIHNDYNGNPRYVVHFMDLGIELKDYGKISGLSKYRAKWYGGGYVIQSYSIEEDLKFYIKKVKQFYTV